MKKYTYDFNDFMNAVQSAHGGKVIVLENQIDNFYNWMDDTSQHKIKKREPKVLLKEIVKAERN